MPGSKSVSNAQGGWQGDRGSTIIPRLVGRRVARGVASRVVSCLKDEDEPVVTVVIVCLACLFSSRVARRAEIGGVIEAQLDGLAISGPGSGAR
jgi:hypothetical protein